MEKLSFQVLNGPEDQSGRLDQRIVEILDAREKAKASLPQNRTDWINKPMSPEILDLMDVIEKVADWRSRNRFEPGAAAGAMAQFCFDRLPAPSRLAKQREWRNLNTYFTNVSHHRRLDDGAATLTGVRDRFEQLEEYLNARWAPETVRDLAAIDQLLAGGFKNAD